MRYGLIVLAILIFSNAYAQNKLVVATTSMNKLYLERDNPVQLSVEGKYCKDLELKINNGTITPVTGADCSYEVKPAHTGSATVTAYDKKTGRLIDSFILRVLNLPNPIISLGPTGDGGYVAVDELARLRGPIAYYECTEMGLYPVVRYRITILRDGNTLFSKLYTDPIFAPELKTVFSTLQKGDVLVFTNVHCKDIRNQMRIIKLAAAEITVR